MLREGHIQASDQVIKTATGPHALSVTDTDALLYLPGRDIAKVRLAARIPALSPGWQQSFRELIDGGERGGPPAFAQGPRRGHTWRSDPDHSFVRAEFKRRRDRCSRADRRFFRGGWR